LKHLRRHLTYANVVATIALFLVVSGGAAYAATSLGKNSVGTRQIKNGAVTAAKIKNGAITGAKVNLGSLGTVPSAANATHAGSADNATHAASATHADSAGTATHADSAGDAATLGGMSAAQVAATAALRCPAGTALAAGLCFETTSRASVIFTAALTNCGAAGRVLPSMSELTTYFAVTKTSSSGEEWVGQLYYDNGVTRAEAISAGPGGTSSAAEPFSAPHQYRCAVPPTN
jgi:hypothetical protein